MKAFIAVLLLVGCDFTTRPPPVPPVESKATCEDVRANLSTLPDACGEDLSTFVQRCEDASEAERELGIAFPRDCLVSSRDCPSARACQ